MTRLRCSSGTMPEDIQYITNESGTRIGVMLDVKTYQKLTSGTSDPDLLVNMSQAELEAIAETKLEISEQSQLDELLARNHENQLSAAEQAVLDKLLNKADSLNIVKARARYTLAHLAVTAS